MSLHIYLCIIFLKEYQYQNDDAQSGTTPIGHEPHVATMGELVDFLTLKHCEPSVDLISSQILEVWSLGTVR